MNATCLSRIAATLALTCCLSPYAQVSGQGHPDPAARAPVRRPVPAPYQAPDLTALAGSHAQDLREAIERYLADQGILQRFYDLPNSPRTREVFQQFYRSWLSALERLDFESLGLDARVDYILFRNKLEQELQRLDLNRRREDQMASLLPFESTIIGLQEARQRVDPLDPAKAAATLASMDKQIEEVSRWVRSGGPENPKISKAVANRAALTVETLRRTLRQWFEFYNSYDPLFTWWAAQPYKHVNASLEKYGMLVREKLAGLEKEDHDTIVGDPIGREALLAELRFALIPYTPEELLALANKE